MPLRLCNTVEHASQVREGSELCDIETKLTLWDAKICSNNNK